MSFRFRPGLPSLLAAAAVVSGMLVWRIQHIRTRFIDPDEFQHLHAAWCIGRGMVPYRDFFEHHMPVYWLPLTGLIRVFGESAATIWAGRGLALIFLLATLAAALALARCCLRPGAALVAAAVLAATTPFTGKAIEIRPDGPGTLFWLIGLVAIARIREGTGYRMPAFAGLMHGLAFLMTPKTAFGILGVVLFLALEALSPARRRAGSAAVMATYGSAGLGVVALSFPVFMMLRALPEFIEHAWLINLRWGRNPNTNSVLARLMTSNGLLVGCAAAGMMSLAARRGGSTGRERAIRACAFGAGALMLGALISPAAQRQYYLPLWPLLAIIAVFAINRALTLFRMGRAIHARALAGCGFAVGTGLLLAAQWFGRPPTLLGSGLLFVLVVAAGFSFLVIASRWQRRRHRTVNEVALTAIFALSSLDSLRYDGAAVNDGQIRALEYVMSHTGPGDFVADGFSGAGTFRPHAYYYWYVHRELNRLLDDRAKGGDYVLALERARPALVVYDEFMRRLPIITRDYIQAHYEPTGVGDIHRRKSASE